MPHTATDSMYGIDDIAAHHALHYLAGRLGRWAEIGQPMLPEDMRFALRQAQQIIDDTHRTYRGAP